MFFLTSPLSAARPSVVPKPQPETRETPPDTKFRQTVARQQLDTLLLQGNSLVFARRDTERDGRFATRVEAALRDCGPVAAAEWSAEVARQAPRERYEVFDVLLNAARHATAGLVAAGFPGVPVTTTAALLGRFPPQDQAGQPSLRALDGLRDLSSKDKAAVAAAWLDSFEVWHLNRAAAGKLWKYTAGFLGTDRAKLDAFKRLERPLLHAGLLEGVPLDHAAAAVAAGIQRTRRREQTEWEQPLQSDLKAVLGAPSPDSEVFAQVIGHRPAIAQTIMRSIDGHKGRSFAAWLKRHGLPVPTKPARPGRIA